MEINRKILIRIAIASLFLLLLVYYNCDSITKFLHSPPFNKTYIGSRDDNYSNILLLTVNVNNDKYSDLLIISKPNKIKNSVKDHFQIIKGSSEKNRSISKIELSYRTKNIEKAFLDNDNSEIYSADYGDIDGDNLSDIVVVYQNGYVGFWLAQNKGQNYSLSYYEQSHKPRIVIGDVDGNKQNKLVILDHTAKSIQLWQYRNQSLKKTFIMKNIYSYAKGKIEDRYYESLNHQDITLADADKDGDLDIFCIGSNEHQTLIFRFENRGNDRFVYKSPVSVPNNISHSSNSFRKQLLVKRLINKDNYPDIITLTYLPGNLGSNSIGIVNYISYEKSKIINIDSLWDTSFWGTVYFKRNNYIWNKLLFNSGLTAGKIGNKDKNILIAFSTDSFIILNDTYPPFEYSNSNNYDFEGNIHNAICWDSDGDDLDELYLLVDHKMDSKDCWYLLKYNGPINKLK